MKKNRLVSLIISAILSFAVFSSSSCASNDGTTTTTDDTVVVELETDNHVRTDSANPQKIKKGENADFHLVFDENYGFLSSSSGLYDPTKRILSISSEDGGGTYFCRSKLISGFVITINNDDTLGDVTISPRKNYYEYGEKVTITTMPNTRDFLCYSFDKVYRKGIGSLNGIPYSFDAKTEITITKDINIYVNYFANGGKIIDYDLNGGLTANGNTTIHTDYIAKYSSELFFANTINLSSYAKRYGYTIDSLNTKADGTGYKVGLGGRINNSYFVDNKVTLYAQWVKWTNPDYFSILDEDSGCCSISSFSNIGSPTVLVIPSEINNKKVTKIRSNAFNNLTNVIELYLSDTIETIQDNAFINLENLKTIHLFSNIKNVSKEAFNAPNIKTLVLSKNTHPTNVDTAWDNMACRREIIQSLDKTKPNILFLGHSTIRANNNLAPLDQKLNGDYNLFIYGASAGIDAYLLFSSIIDLIRDIDYVVIPVWIYTTNNFSGPRNLSFLQYNFEVLSNAKYECIKEFIWDSLMAYRDLCTDALDCLAALPEGFNIVGTMDKYGSNQEGESIDDPNNGDGGNHDNFFINYCDITKFSHIKKFVDDSNLLNSHVLITWNPYNQTSITNLTYYNKFEQTIREGFPDYTYFDSQIDNIYPGNYFKYRDFTHLSPYGGSKRVERWLDDLPF